VGIRLGEKRGVVMEEEGVPFAVVIVLKELAIRGW